LQLQRKNQLHPGAAKAAFAKAYPNATKVKWEKENGNYEVVLLIKAMKYPPSTMQRCIAGSGTGNESK
jgi:hypothetical protein